MHLIEFLSPALAKEGESLNDFKFGTFVGRFSSDGAACMAVKELTAASYVELLLAFSLHRFVGNIARKTCRFSEISPVKPADSLMQVYLFNTMGRDSCEYTSERSWHTKIK